MRGRLRTVDFRDEEARASFFTSSENVSAPEASEARARLVVFAATVPKAAAKRSPDANADIATSSAALIVLAEELLLRPDPGLLRSFFELVFRPLTPPFAIQVSIGLGVNRI